MQISRAAALVAASLALVATASLVPAASPAHAATPTAFISGSTIVYNSGENFFDVVTVNGFAVNYRFTSDGPVTPGAGCTPFNTNAVDCPFAAISTVNINMGGGANSVTLQYTQPGDTINVNGGTGSDGLMMGVGNLSGYAAVNFNSGGGNDTTLVNDSVAPTAQTWMLSPGTIHRSGVLAVALAGPTGVELWAGNGDDTINIGYTPAIFSTRVQGGAGNDNFVVAAAGLGSTGDLRIDGVDPATLPGDSLAVYTGGLAVGDNNAGTITTAGRQPIIYMAIEQRSIVPSTDVDADGCPDVREGAGDHILGGDRSPLDFWDFYDVTADQKIDLADALTLLAKFGVGPPGPGEPANGYVEAQDRVSGPANKPWRSAKATGANVGMTLQDVLANLQAFGDDCTVQG